MPDSPVVVTSKVVLRTALLAARDRRPAGERAAAALAVAEYLQRHLHGYLPGTTVVAGHVPTDAEPGHGQLPAALAVPGTRVLLPVVPPTGRELDWAVWTGPLAEGRYRLLEPTGPRLPATALGEAGLVVVPALAVGRDGTRLGRGGGYYDRALAYAAPTAVLVAVLFDEELLDELPAEPHDRRVHAVVTPSRGWVQLGA